jgi:hypothetical protein
VNNPLMSKKMISMLLNFLVVLNGCLTSPEPSMPFKHPCTAHASFPERSSNHCWCFRHTFSKICTEVDSHLLSDPSRNRIRPDTRLQIKGHKKSARPLSCMKFCTLTSKTCQYYHLPLHHAATIAVQMAAPVPEIIK